jgi:hypothetical protein
MKKAFTQLQEMREDASDISDSEASEGDSHGDSHFQIDVDGFQFAQVDKEFEPQIAKLFEQAWRNTKNIRNDVNLGCDKNFILSRLSPGTSKVLRRGRSRVQKSHGLCTPSSVTRPGWIFSG